MRTKEKQGKQMLPCAEHYLTHGNAIDLALVRARIILIEHFQPSCSRNAYDRMVFGAIPEFVEMHGEGVHGRNDIVNKSVIALRHNVCHIQKRLPRTLAL